MKKNLTRIGKTRKCYGVTPLQKALGQIFWEFIFINSKHNQNPPEMGEGRRKGIRMNINELGTENNYLKKVVKELQTKITELTGENEKLKVMTITDPLTKLHNRKGIMEFFAQEYKRAGRDGVKLTVITFDIDHFKNINDTYGHPVGDVVLAEIGKIIKERVRETDKAGRL